MKQYIRNKKYDHNCREHHRDVWQFRHRVNKSNKCVDLHRLRCCVFEFVSSLNPIDEPMVTVNDDSTDWLVVAVILILQLNFDSVIEMLENVAMEVFDRHLKLHDDVFVPMLTLLLLDEHYVHSNLYHR